MAPGAPITIRQPEVGELEDFAACVEVSFGVRSLPRERERFLSASRQAFLLAAFDGAELVGTLASYPVSQTLPGPVLATVSALCDVAVKPTHRRRGIFAALMGHFLANQHEQGEPIALLAAAEGGLHGRFGFGPATWSARYGLDRSASAFLPGVLDGAVGELRLLTRFEASEALPALHEEIRRQTIGELERPPGAWEALLGEDDGPLAPPRYYLAYCDSGAIDGCAIYDLVAGPGDGEREVLLVELLAKGPSAYAALCRFLLDLDLFRGLRTLERPVEEPLRHLLSDPRALRTLEIRDGAWLRLVDVAAALPLRRYRGPGQVAFEITDGQCPWNSGCTRLEVDAAGVGQATSSSGPPDLALSVSSLGAVFLGGTSFRALAAAGRVGECTVGAAARADDLFGGGPVPFCLPDL